MLKKLIPIMFLFTLIMVGCNEQAAENNADNSVADSMVTDNNQVAAMPDNTVAADVQSAHIDAQYTMDEISKHSKRDDCWLVIDGKVYDVSEFVGMHPGGDKILEGCGIDATKLYETKSMDPGVPHSEKAAGMLEKYLIGNQI